jgi:hypothetical protein
VGQRSGDTAVAAVADHEAGLRQDRLVRGKGKERRVARTVTAPGGMAPGAYQDARVEKAGHIEDVLEVRRGGLPGMVLRLHRTRGRWSPSSQGRCQPGGAGG